MRQLKLLIVILFYSTIANARGGCGSAIEIKNPTSYSKIIHATIDTIRRELNPVDSVLIFQLYRIDGNCDIINAHWFKNGKPINGSLQCESAGPGIYRTTYQTDAPYIVNYDITIIVTTQPTTVDEIESAADFIVFPNPTVSGLFTLKRDIAEPCILKIYDLHGRVVKEQKITGRSAVVDISIVEKGVYILELTSANGLKRRKRMVFN